MFSRDYLVHYYEIDRRRRLTPPALLHYFEDIATLNSEAAGFPLDYYWKTGQLFLLLKWDVAVSSWPLFGETVRIETRPTTFKRFLANREYRVIGKNGNALAEARSVWIFTDLRARKPVRVPEEIYGGFGVAGESGASFDNLEELPEFDGDAPPLRIAVGPADLDNNDHVNNVRYVEWALRSLPAGFAAERAASRIQVHYKKELHCGDEAELVTGISDRDGRPQSDHSIRCGDREACRIRLEWAG
ncbi:MAG: acyl-ACP thioesterase domain-containing protein [Thermodesulfobacteriota bacterium]